MCASPNPGLHRKRSCFSSSRTSWHAYFIFLHHDAQRTLFPVHKKTPQKKTTHLDAKTLFARMRKRSACVRMCARARVWLGRAPEMKTCLNSGSFASVPNKGGDKIRRVVIFFFPPFNLRFTRFRLLHESLHACFCYYFISHVNISS